MEHRKLSSVLPVIGVAYLASFAGALAQTSSPQFSHPVAATAPTAVPALVSYSGIAFGNDGKALTVETSITFLVFNDAQGGEPLFTETQAVVPDPTGRYKVQLGATFANGIPAELFSTGEARWLEIQIAGQAPQPRVLLASVPYALKAADATTLGGLPASAFALAGAKTPANTALATGVTPDAASTVTTTGGTANKVAKFSGASTIVNSMIYDNGTDVGIGTTSPSATLTVTGTATVNGNSTLNGQVVLPALGTATATKSFDSQFIKLQASAFNSATNAVIPPRFQLQAEATGNNTSTANGTLNLLASASNGAPAETGLYIHTNGDIHFAPGQIFPDTSTAFPANSNNSAYFGGAGNPASTGSNDTASGYQALASNKTGSLDTAIGYSAGPDPASTGLTNATAIGANSVVSQSNSLVLGKTTAGSPGASHVNVGIGTAKPASALEVSVKAASALGPTVTLTNPGGAGGSPTNAGTATSIDFNSYLPSAEPEGPLPEARISAVDNGEYSDDLIFSSKYISGQFSFLQQNLTIEANGRIAIGTPPSDVLPSLTAQLSIFQPYFTPLDGIDVEGGDGGTGIVATGGEITCCDSIQGGTGGTFVGGYSPGTTGNGLYAAPGDAEFSESGGWAAVFAGDIDVTGTVFGGAKDFKIDHPSDPANKYLVHTSVESSEMVNIYSGNVVTDELGNAVVNLPNWFQAENGDFRYQLTVIGGRFAQAVVSKEIANNQFAISTNATNVKVSWQVTAVRQDPYAKAHPLVVEQAKPVRERGFYEHPELYGQPTNKQTEWARNPQQMQRIKIMRDQQKLNSQQHAAPKHPVVAATQPSAAEPKIKPVS